MYLGKGRAVGRAFGEWQCQWGELASWVKGGASEEAREHVARLGTQIVNF